jgi:nucleoid-associated protein YgaU
MAHRRLSNFRSWRAGRTAAWLAAVAVAGVGCKTQKPVDETAIPDRPTAEKSDSFSKPAATASTWKDAGRDTAEPAPYAPTSYASTTSSGAPTGRSYVVKKGDTMYSIARVYYRGDVHKWKAIYDANRDRIPDPNQLKVGQTLVIPD